MICLVYLEQASSFSSVQRMTSLHLQGAATSNDMQAWTRFSPAGRWSWSKGGNDSQALFMHAMRGLREIILMSF
jgi:hypothetical protein